MKKILPLFCFLLVGNLLYSQKTSVEASKQAWSNGICCAHGTNYTVVLKSNIAEFKNTEIISICIDGKKFAKKELKIKHSKTGSWYKMTITFGYSEDNRKENNMFDEDTKEVETPKNYTDCTSQGIRYKLNGKIVFRAINKIKEIPSVPRP